MPQRYLDILFGFLLGFLLFLHVELIKLYLIKRNVFKCIKKILQSGGANFSFYYWSEGIKLIGYIVSGKFPRYPKRRSLLIIERIFILLFVLFRLISIGYIINCFFKKSIKPWITDCYVVFFFIFFIALLFYWHPYIPFIWLFWIVIYRIVEQINYLFCIVFVDRYRLRWHLRSLNRSLLTLILNYFQVIIGFAIIYLASSSIGYSKCNNLVHSPKEAFYFSMGTITTLVYDDVIPIAPISQQLAVWEPFLGFIILVFMIGIFLTGVKDIKE